MNTLYHSNIPLQFSACINSLQTVENNLEEITKIRDAMINVRDQLEELVFMQSQYNDTITQDHVSNPNLSETMRQQLSEAINQNLLHAIASFRILIEMDKSDKKPEDMK